MKVFRSISLNSNIIVAYFPINKWFSYIDIMLKKERDFAKKKRV